jgi:crotonobetainyl-CoA:carnitine CoA-transferase CaiB-like acyl-CoA transferase
MGTEESETGTPLPLEGIRVLDLSRVFAMPYAAGHLADLGAEVIRVEACHLPDSRLQLHALPDNEPGGLFWERSGTFHTLNRGKRSITLDLRSPEALGILRRLVGISDILIENYTLRVSRRFGLDYASLRELRPNIIALSNTGYGHSGPWSSYGAVASTLESVHGTGAFMAYEGIPAKIGNSYTDFIAAWTALFALMSALIYRARTGRGLWIDLAMYQVGASFVGEGIMDFAFNGQRRRSLGNGHLAFAPHGCYPCRGDDQWMVLAVQHQGQWLALCDALGRPDLAQDPRYLSINGRYSHRKELDEIIIRWTRGRDKYEIMDHLQELGVPCGPVLNSWDLFTDPHFRSRGFFEEARHSPESGVRSRHYLSRGWRMSGLDLRIRSPGPALGEANEYVLGGLLGMSTEEIKGLEKAGVIGRRPQGVGPPRPLSLEKQKTLGWIQDYNKAYLEDIDTGSDP